MKDNENTWNGVAPIVDAVDELETGIEEIETKAQQQEEKGSAGYTADKQNKMDTLAEEGLSLCLKIRPYARKKKDEILLAMVDHSKSSLEEGTDIEVLSRCKIIFEKAKEYKDDLASYMITDATLADMEKAINDASPVTAKRDNVQGQRSQITSTLVELFDASKETLSTLDDLIEGIFNKTNPEFVTTYQNTRKVNERVGRHAKVENAKAVTMDENSKKDVL